MFAYVWRASARGTDMLRPAVGDPFPQGRRARRGRIPWTVGRDRTASCRARRVLVSRALVCLGQTVFVAFEGFAELMRVVGRRRLLPAVLPRDLDL
jgi:hypothetical protein